MAFPRPLRKRSIKMSLHAGFEIDRCGDGYRKF